MLAVLGSGSLLGVAFSPYLVTHYPLLLVALSPLGRHLVLAAPVVDPVALTLVITVRRMLFYTACFFVGRAGGPSAIVWIEGQSRAFGRFVRWLETLFARASHAVVLFFVGPTVSMLAGVSRMRPRVFFGLALVGLVARVVVLIGFAELFRPAIEAILAWIERYWLPATIATVLAVAVYRWRRRQPLPLMED